MINPTLGRGPMTLPELIGQNLTEDLRDRYLIGL